MAKAKATKVEDSTAQVEMVRGEAGGMIYCTMEELQTKIGNIRSGALPNISELCQSIEEMGLLQPLSVRASEDGTSYDVVDGHRRFQSLEKLYEKHGSDWEVVDFSNIPVTVGTGGNEAFILLQQATSNLQRVDTAPEDLGEMCQKLMAPPYNMEVPQLASHLGKKSDFILDLIKYIESADDETKQLVRDGKMSFRQGVDSLELSDEQREAVKKLGKATKSKTEAKSKVKKALDAAKGKEVKSGSKQGGKALEDRLMVCQGVLGDKSIFSTLDPKEVEQLKGAIGAIEWALGQRNSFPAVPKKAEKAFMVKYEAAAEKATNAAEAEKLQAKAAKAKAKAEKAAEKAAEVAAAAEEAAAAAQAAA